MMVEGLLGFWQQHMPLFSVLLPALTAVLLVLLGDARSSDPDSAQRSARRQRWISISSALLGLAMAGVLLGHAQQGVIVSYALGEWQAPFGINLVLDRLSA